MTWIKVSPPKEGKWNAPPPRPPPSCEDRRWCRGVSVKWYGHGSFEHIAHSGGKNDPDDKRASCKIQAFVAFRNWIKFGTFIYLTDTLRRSQRLRIWFKSRGVKLYSDFRRLVTLNEIEQRWMPWSLITDPWNSAKNLVQVTIHVLVLQCNTITYTCKKIHYFRGRKRALRRAYIPQVRRFENTMPSGVSPQIAYITSLEGIIILAPGDTAPYLTMLIRAYQLSCKLPRNSQLL